MTAFAAHPAVHIGHVHLRVSDLERSSRFYRDLLGFDVRADGRPFGIKSMFLAAGDYHHHIGLSAADSAGTAPGPGQVGLYHFAMVYPGADELARAVQRLQAEDYPIDRAQDHGGTVSVYLRDPDGNGIELYYDRPRSMWYDAQGRPVLKNESIAVEAVARG